MFWQKHTQKFFSKNRVSVNYPKTCQIHFIVLLRKICYAKIQVLRAMYFLRYSHEIKMGKITLNLYLTHIYGHANSPKNYYDSFALS